MSARREVVGDITIVIMQFYKVALVQNIEFDVQTVTYINNTREAPYLSLFHLWSAQIRSPH